MAVNTAMDHERLCSLDVLGLADSPSGDQGVVYQEFREHLSRDPDEGWYETSLPWKGDHPPLYNYYNGSIRRMHNLVRRLRMTGKIEEYDAIIREQIEEGIVERAPSEAVGREFYMPHRAVVREGAESTKTRVVLLVKERDRPSTTALMLVRRSKTSFGTYWYEDDFTQLLWLVTCERRSCRCESKRNIVTLYDSIGCARSIRMKLRLYVLREPCLVLDLLHFCLEA
jgi:hypothetical protein